MKRLPLFGKTTFLHIKQEDFDCEYREFYTTEDFPVSCKEEIESAPDEFKVLFRDGNLFVHNKLVKTEEFIKSTALRNIVDNDYIAEKGYCTLYKDVWINREFNKTLFDKNNEYYYEDKDCPKCGHLLEVKDDYRWSKGIKARGKVLKCSNTECFHIDISNVKFKLLSREAEFKKQVKINKGVMSFEPNEENIKLFKDKFGLHPNLDYNIKKECPTCYGHSPMEIIWLGREKGSWVAASCMYRCTNCGHQMSSSIIDKDSPEGRSFSEAIGHLSEYLGED